MKTEDQTNQFGQAQAAQEPRLPQIDPMTFSALSMLDGFVARAALTRQEHAEANKSLQHLVQTIEVLQATVKEGVKKEARNGSGQVGQTGAGSAAENGSGGETIGAEVAEEVFRNARATR
jgi:hypothetical protein